MAKPSFEEQLSDLDTRLKKLEALHHKEIRMLDAYDHVSKSLDALTINLPKGEEQTELKKNRDKLIDVGKMLMSRINLIFEEDEPQDVKFIDEKNPIFDVRRDVKK